MDNRPPRHWTTRHSIASMTIAAIVTLLAATSPGTAQCRYEITTVRAPDCPFSGPPALTITSINNMGHFAGWHNARCDGVTEAFLWTTDRGFEMLPRPAFFQSAQALGLNDLGQVVGRLQRNSQFRAVLWDSGKPVELGVLPDHNHSAAMAINNAGQIVGSSYDTIRGNPWRAILWQDGEMIVLDLPRGPNAQAIDINASGMITGWMGNSSTRDATVFIWEGGDVLELPLPPDAIAAVPVEINEAGQVVGNWFPTRSEGNDRLLGAFFWDGSRVHDLGLLQEHEITVDADSLNDVGQIVGRAVDAEHLVSRFLWQTGRRHDLDTLLHEIGVRAISPCVVSRDGRIVCRGDDAAGENVAVILTPQDDRAGDTNIDCRVDIDDVLNVLRSWGPCDSCHADRSGNGVVDREDLSIVLADWG